MWEHSPVIGPADNSESEVKFLLWIASLSDYNNYNEFNIMIIIDRGGAVWFFLVCGIFLVVTVTTGWWSVPSSGKRSPGSAFQPGLS